MKIEHNEEMQHHASVIGLSILRLTQILPDIPELGEALTLVAKGMKNFSSIMIKLEGDQDNVKH